VRITLIYLVLSIAMVVLSFNLFLPLLASALGDFWGKVLGAVVTILLISPFLRAMIMKKIIPLSSRHSGRTAVSIMHR